MRPGFDPRRKLHFRGRRPGRSPATLAGLLMAVMLAVAQALTAGESSAEEAAPLLGRVTPEVLETVFPDAHRLEALADGGPVAAAAFDGESRLAGYVFSTLDVLRAPGFSSIPFDVIAGVDLSGRVTGSAVLSHREPYIMNDERRSDLLDEYLFALAGIEARAGATDGPNPKYVAGATISARAMRAAVREAGDLVLRYRTGEVAVTKPTVDMVNFKPFSPEELFAQGAVSRVVVANADVTAALDRAGMAGMPLELPMRGGPEEVYIDFRIGIGMSPSIGRNGAGRNVYEKAMARMAGGGAVLMIASKGPYDFMGFRYRNESSGFTLDRLRVVQGDRTFALHRDDLIRAGSALGTPVALIILPPGSGFDPLAPWRAEIAAYVKTANGELSPVLLAAVDHQLPPAYVLMPEPEPAPAWMEAWIDSQTDVAILGAALSALTLLLAFQHRLTRSRRLHRGMRTGFLIFTLVWLGWMAGGQLSIVHLINYLQAPFLGLDWTFYMAEPLIVVISAYTALSLLLLGRGVFCGWLCPFGALQELVANAARFFRLPQWNPAEDLQTRLWMGKYASLALVVGLAFLWPDAGDVAAEIEPFKTAITSVFTRAWPYLLYAGALLAIGLFTERAFCRFLCPLGGALALLDRMHILTLLKRRPECGNPCSLCQRACPVRAINASGKIEMSECFQCLDCQVEYHDDRRCPPLVRLRKQGDRAAARPEAAFAFAPSVPSAPAAR